MKNNSFRLIIMVLTTTFFVSCGGIDKMMQSWVGSTKHDLVMKWGSPTSTTDDGAGGEILTYSSYVNTGQTAGQVYSNGSYTAPQQNGYVRQRVFYVNSSGVIYHWSWRGF